MENIRYFMFKSPEDKPVYSNASDDVSPSDAEAAEYEQVGF